MILSTVNDERFTCCRSVTSVLFLAVEDARQEEDGDRTLAFRRTVDLEMSLAKGKVEDKGVEWGKVRVCLGERIVILEGIL